MSHADPPRPEGTPSPPDPPPPYPYAAAQQPGSPYPSQPYPSQPYPDQGGYPPGPGYPPIPAYPGGGYPPVPPNPRTNGFAIASLVLGIVTPVCAGIGGVLSVIFGVIALKKIAERGEKGKGLAIGGMATTGGWVVVFAALVAIGIATDTDTGTGSDPAGDGAVSADALTTGDCVSDLPDEDIVRRVSTVACDQPHEGQVYAQFDLATTDWPGEDAVFEQADSGCLDRLEDEFPDAYADAAVDLFYLYPTQASWTFGDREVVCVAYYTDGDRTGSLFD